MSIYNSPLLLAFYSLLGWTAKTPERPLVSFFSGSLKQTVYFCRLIYSSSHIKRHHPSVVFFWTVHQFSFPEFGWGPTHISQNFAYFTSFILPFSLPSWALQVCPSFLPLFLSFGFPCLTALSWSSVTEVLVATWVILLAPVKLQKPNWVKNLCKMSFEGQVYTYSIIQANWTSL